MQNQNTRKKILTLISIVVLGFVFCSAGYAENEIEFVPGEDSGFFYIIKKGDTLWDLSQKFYNSNWDWPALWEMNPDIKNPHWIYPGRKIRIFFKEKGKLKPIIVSVKKSPPELIQPSFSLASMDRIGFIKKEAHPALGSIIREKDGREMISTGNIIYIKPTGNGEMIPGSTYHVYDTSPIEEKLNSEDKEPFTGIKHLIKASIKIIEDKGEYVSAKVTETYRAVNNNDLIMDYYDRDEVLTVEENPEPIDAKVICAEDNMLMINDLRIGFISAGSQVVKPGQIYTIKRLNENKQHKLYNSGKKDKNAIKLEDIESGKLIVLHTEDVAATVMILSSEYAIHEKDMVN